jgi:chemotaxis protein histidine kinase CheA
VSRSSPHLEDVRGVLLEQWGSMDFEYVERVLAARMIALDDPRLAPRFGRVVRQVERLLDQPPRR